MQVSTFLEKHNELKHSPSFDAALRGMHQHSFEIMIFHLTNNVFDFPNLSFMVVPSQNMFQLLTEVLLPV